MAQQLVLPSEIPWQDLKGIDLEECLYWLVHALGAKDLEWRIGGAGAGASDGGRDLAATFYTPGPDGEVSRQKWWIEAKGRTGTVEPAAVRDAVMNAFGHSSVDVIVLATNTVFSNPTRDWIADWQKDHPRPSIRLWDRHHLERLLSDRPEVAIRLFARALSLAGKLEVVRSRFWNYTAYAGEPMLDELWRHRNELEWSDMDLLAALISECANGDVAWRPWAMLVDKDRRLVLLQHALGNVLYFCLRADDAGVAQEPYLKGAAYLLLASLHVHSPEAVATSIGQVWSEKNIPAEVQRHALVPVLTVLSSQLRDLCTDECRRVSTDPLELSDSEMEFFWARLREPSAVSDGRQPDRAFVTIEKFDEACDIGLPLTGEVRCPISDFERRDDRVDIPERLSLLHTIIHRRAPNT